jgi:alcohol dehydrogenase class IV
VGSLHEISGEVSHLDSRRALIITSPGRSDPADRISALLGDRCAGIHAGAMQHVPYATVRAAVEDVRRRDADLLVAAGGGSTIGLAKGVALETRLPILAVPTTYSGSEMTHIWGISRDGQKTTGRDPVVKPRTVIYDPELLRTLPPALSLTSGINGMAHAVEALYAKDGNPVATLLAEESIRTLARSLPLVVADPADVQARALSLYGAWLAAAVLDMVGMALHHKLCHTLGGSFGLPHSQTHTVILPYAVGYNAPAIPDALAAMARALGCDPDEVPGRIQDLSRDNGGPVSLRELGFPADGVARAAALATRKPYDNPRPVTEEALRRLLEEAYRGVRPG